MNLLGLTGGIGMGKSTSAQLLRDLGVAVIDTDDIARQIVEPGQPALAEILSAFGPQFLDPFGQLRRAELAQKVFTDPSARSHLEHILHPRIRVKWTSQADVWRKEGRTSGVVVIPLLFETSAAEAFDAVVCVACLTATQTDRLLSRGWSKDQIRQRIGAQWPVARKMELSDHVIWTEGSISLHREQLERILRR